MLNFAENLTCIDESWSRLSRLKDISKWYIGETPSSMSISKTDGKLLEDPFYNKVHISCNSFVIHYSDSCEHEPDKQKNIFYQVLILIFSTDNIACRYKPV